MNKLDEKRRRNLDDQFARDNVENSVNINFAPYLASFWIGHGPWLSG